MTGGRANPENLVPGYVSSSLLAEARLYGIFRISLVTNSADTLSSLASMLNKMLFYSKAGGGCT